MSRPAATINVDVDPVDLHLVGYGHTGLPPDPSVYHAAVPRLIELFARLGLRATFFMVGRDAATHASTLRAIADAGHELASHSFSHPFAFARLPTHAMRAELEDSRAALEAAGGRPVIGFRSPNFDVDRGALRAIAESGYAYDASAYPTPLLGPARVVLAVKSGRLDALRRLRTWPVTFRREPFRFHDGGRSLVEFPLAVSGGMRVPVYHTARYFLSRDAFERHLDGIARRGGTLSYPLHAVDALGLEEDRVDRRLERHPGMGLALARKLALLEESLAAIARRFDCTTFEARVAAI